MSSLRKIDTADQAKVRAIDPTRQSKLVGCAIHGQQRGYVICMCCLQFGQPVAHVEPPKPGQLGEILCKRKTGHRDPNLQHELRLICHKCAVAAGLLTVKAS